MPQGPISSTVAKTPANVNATMSLDSGNNLMTSQGGLSSHLDITAATVVKATPGRIAKVVVLVAGSAAGSVNDIATTGGVTTANEVFAIPNTAGVYDLDFPMAVGIVVVPGTGQTLAVSYS